MYQLYLVLYAAFSISDIRAFPIPVDLYETLVECEAVARGIQDVVPRSTFWYLNDPFTGQRVYPIAHWARAVCQESGPS